MPNLNLNDDGSEETPMESLPPESELDFDESPSVIRRVLPYIASGILALLVAGFILNRTGIIHLWGTKKSVSAVVTVPTEPESQTLSDSAMMEQFRIDSAQIATGSTPVQSATPAPQKNEKETKAQQLAEQKKKEKETKAQQLAEQKKKEKETKAQQLAEQKKKEKETKAQQLAEQKKKAEDAKAARLAEQKKKAEAAQAQKLAEQKKQADAAEAKKQAAEKKAAELAEAKKQAQQKKEAVAAEAKIQSELKKMAAAAEEKRLAEKKKAAELAKRNETYVEVPGYPVHRSPIVVAEKPAPPAPEQQQRVTEKKESQAQKPVAQAEPVKKNAAAKTAENKPAVRTEKVKPSAAAQSTQLAENKPASKVSTKPPAPSAVSDAAAAGEMGSGNYSVQIASWRNAEKATAQANQFTEAGIQAFVSPQGGIYRVCVGRFKSSAAAARRAEELVPMLETKYEIIKVK